MPTLAGLRVIVDFVPNHTSDQHAWFIESRSSRRSPKRDWYVWRDPNADGGPPNNWISVFGGSAWALDESTGQYYLHSFLAEQPDLDWRVPDVKQAMFDVLRFWLDRGVDGFRIDVAQFIAKDPLYRDNPPHPDPERMAYMGAWSRQLHLYDHGHPDLHAIYREFRALLDSYPGDRVSIGELHDEQFDVWAGLLRAQPRRDPHPVQLPPAVRDMGRGPDQDDRRRNRGGAAQWRVAELGARQP